ncbi:MAG: hypothetical protein JWM02_3620, partial [Frankiales bacterium]|nr:hypothetical protein [Frankiales bacterium]
IRSTMLEGTSVELHTDITTAMYRAIWAGIDQSRELRNVG